MWNKDESEDDIEEGEIDEEEDGDCEVGNCEEDGDWEVGSCEEEPWTGEELGCSSAETESYEAYEAGSSAGGDFGAEAWTSEGFGSSSMVPADGYEAGSWDGGGNETWGNGEYANESWDDVQSWQGGVSSQTPDGGSIAGECTAENWYGTELSHVVGQGTDIWNAREQYRTNQKGGNRNSKQTSRNSKRNRKQDDFPFFCEVCDRPFKNNEKYENHLKEHVVCGIDGCKLFAHPKIIAVHVRLQHSTGLAKKVMNIQTPEEIAQWRAERRRRYPTALKQKEKTAQQTEMHERGERFQPPNKRFNRQRQGKNFRRQQHRKQRGFREPQQQKITNKVESVPINQTIEMELKEALEPKKGVVPFGGTAMYPQEEEEVLQIGADGTRPPISDSEWEDTENTAPKEVPSVTMPVVSSVLGSLMADYASTQESDVEEVSNNNRLQADAINLIQNKNECDSAKGADQKDNCIENSKDSSKDVMITDKEPEKYPKRKRNRNRKRKHPQNIPFESSVSREERNTPKMQEKQDDSRSKPKWMKWIGISKKYTLLEKLLQPDICHERNVVLQCVRYVVKHNFFGVGQERNRTETVDNQESDRTETVDNRETNRTTETVDNVSSEPVRQEQKTCDQMVYEDYAAEVCENINMDVLTSLPGEHKKNETLTIRTDDNNHLNSQPLESDQFVIDKDGTTTLSNALS